MWLLYTLTNIFIIMSQVDLNVFRFYRKLKREYPELIILIRNGSFYESFNEDAKIVSGVLNISLNKCCTSDDTCCYVASFANDALDLPRLILAGHRLVIRNYEGNK